jgi:hypothetical protein
MLIDNTGQVDASETVRFGVDGHAYEIDLPARRASELRSMAGRYISVARRIPPARSRARQQPAGPGDPGTAGPNPATSGAATAEPSRGRGAARAARDEPAATASLTATGADVRGGEHGLTDGEKQELRAIADAARPQRNIVAGRLRAKGLADRDTAGNWWLTDAGRRELMSA